MPADMLPNPSLFLIDPGGTIFGPGPYIKTWRSEDGEDIMNERIRCPYGYPGDRLWVRETFAAGEPGHPSGAGLRVYLNLPREKQCDTKIVYASDEADVYYPPIPWRPSIHMPRWASRITLEVVSVKVERLQDISVADAKAEGIRCSDCPPGFLTPDRHYCGCRSLFANLWDDINDKRGYGWSQNPWVWVVEFRRVS
jgi:hypothetical protein